MTVLGRAIGKSKPVAYPARGFPPLLDCRIISCSTHHQHDTRSDNCSSQTPPHLGDLALRLGRVSQPGGAGMQAGIIAACGGAYGEWRLCWWPSLISHQSHPLADAFQTRPSQEPGDMGG